MIRSAAGTAAATEDVDLALSSTVPPGTIVYPTGNSAFNAWTLACRASTTVAGNTFATRSLWTVSVGFRSRRQISGHDGSEFVCDFANLRRLGTTHAVLQRPADGWPQFKRRKTGHYAGKFLD